MFFGLSARAGGREFPATMIPCPGSSEQPSLESVPLFPLPNVVLFPRAEVLPLHIFEERYRTMTGRRLGWPEAHRHGPAQNPAGKRSTIKGRPIEPVVCVGQILSWEQLPDGKYNFLLQGRWRARIVREHGGGPYRLADLAVLDETPTLEIDLEADRAHLRDLFEGSRLALLPVARQFRELMETPLTTAEVADLAAFNLLDDVPLKQELLGDRDVRRRVGRVVEALRASASHLSPGLLGLPEDPGLN